MAIDSVKSAARVLDLLELFDRCQRPLSLREIVEETGYPQSSTAALLATLIARGYIAHDRRSRVYVSTPAVAHLGRWVSDDGVASEPALYRAIQQLHRLTGETAVAAVRRNVYAQYVVVQQTTRPIVVQTQPGVLRPICTSATGLALLSTMSDEAIRQIATQARRERRGLSRPVPLTELRRRIEETRQWGFAVSRHGVFEGTGMIAMPLNSPICGHTVALGVGGPVVRLDAKMSKLVAALKDAVKNVFGPA